MLDALYSHFLFTQAAFSLNNVFLRPSM